LVSFLYFLYSFSKFLYTRTNFRALLPNLFYIVEISPSYRNTLQCLLPGKSSVSILSRFMRNEFISCDHSFHFKHKSCLREFACFFHLINYLEMQRESYQYLVLWFSQQEIDKFKMHRELDVIIFWEREKSVLPRRASCQDVDQIYIFKEVPTRLSTSVKGGWEGEDAHAYRCICEPWCKCEKKVVYTYIYIYIYIYIYRSAAARQWRLH